MRTITALPIVTLMLLTGLAASKLDDETGDRLRTGNHWDLVALLDYCRELHELVLKNERKQKKGGEFEELKDALAEKNIVSLMSVTIHVIKQPMEQVELRFWRDATESRGSEIQVVLKLRRRGNGYQWERIERIYENHRARIFGYPLIYHTKRIPPDLAKDHWQRTTEGRWQGMVDLATTLAQFTDALIAADKTEQSRLSLFGVDSYPEVQTFRQAIANLKSVAMETLGSNWPDYCVVTLRSRVHVFVLGFVATPSGWKYQTSDHGYLEGQ